MRIVHTFCGKSALAKNVDVAMCNWMYALSTLYIKQNATANMILYVDEIGSNMLSSIKYLYDEVHKISIPETIDPIFFAAIKVYALKHEPLGSVYIDGDVYFKKKDAYQRLLKVSNNVDCVTQGMEVNNSQYGEVNYYRRIGYQLDHTISHTIPCNTGVLGFFNASLRSKYIQNYQTAAKEISAIGDFDGCGVPDIILEQAYLISLVREEGYRMGEVVTGVNFESINRFANKIGYCHMWSNSKYYQLSTIKQRLKEINQDVYNKLTEKFGKELYNSNSLGEL